MKIPNLLRIKRDYTQVTKFLHKKTMKTDLKFCGIALTVT